MSLYNAPPGEGGAPPPAFDCDLCFDVGETPNVCYFCMAGVKIGDLWNPALPPPPNGVWAMTPQAECNWLHLVGTTAFLWRMLPPPMLVISTVLGQPNFFAHVGAIACSYWVPNVFAVPAGNRYYGGWVMIVPKYEGGSWSVPELMHLFNDDSYWAPWINPRPTAANNTYYNIYNPQDATRVKVQIDHT